MARKTYTREFKVQAVAMLTDQGLSVTEVSRLLGVGTNCLRAWRDAARQKGDAAFPGQGILPAAPRSAGLLPAKPIPRQLAGAGAIPSAGRSRPRRPTAPNPDATCAPSPLRRGGWGVRWASPRRQPGESSHPLQASPGPRHRPQLIHRAQRITSDPRPPHRRSSSAASCALDAPSERASKRIQCAPKAPWMRAGCASWCAAMSADDDTPAPRRNPPPGTAVPAGVTPRHAAYQRPTRRSECRSFRDE
jgi:transposase